MTGLALFAAGLGAIVGSFLNVVVYRLPRGEPLGLVRRSRSHCPSCDAVIRWFDNIPLVSWLVLRGRCRTCRWRIPARYPLVEASTAALFALAALRTYELSWSPAVPAFLLCAAFLAVLVAASAIDFTHKLLPDALTLRAGPALAALASLLVPGMHGTAVFGLELGGAVKPGLASLIVGLAGLAVGGGVILLVRWAGHAVLRREAMGLGDVKLMATCGLMLGPEGVLFALGAALFSGAILGTAIWAVTRDREISFGPFLALGSAAALLYAGPLAVLVLETWPAWVRGG